MVDFALTLPASMKVRGLTLRYFFKSALRGFLPDEIIRKKKHGFGLPFGPWLVRDKALARFATIALDKLAERGLIRRELVDDLFSNCLSEHSGFYGEMVWVLMMLEHWLEHRAPSFEVDCNTICSATMRDILIFLIVGMGGIPLILRNPAVGIGYGVWISLMNPHRAAWGFAYSFPFGVRRRNCDNYRTALDQGATSNERAARLSGYCSPS